MPNGGPRPDCFHCNRVEGDRHNPYSLTCKLHKMILASPIYAFCSQFEDAEPADGVDWLDQELNRSELRSDIMYVWIGLELEDQEGKGKHVFDSDELAPIEDYATWTLDQFLEAIRLIAEKKHQEYQRKGYKSG